MNDENPRHVKIGRREMCEKCEHVRMVAVSVDRWSGQAAFTCPVCEHTQEPAGGPVDLHTPECDFEECSGNPVARVTNDPTGIKIVCEKHAEVAFHRGFTVVDL